MDRYVLGDTESLQPFWNYAKITTIVDKLTLVEKSHVLHHPTLPYPTHDHKPYISNIWVIAEEHAYVFK